MAPGKDIRQTIISGIGCIKTAQRPDGSFESLSSFRTDDFSEATPYSTTFFTSTVLSCLNSPEGDFERILEDRQEILADVQTVRRRAAEFLTDEMHPGCSWGYWSRAAKERQTMPYPDDLDDTFAALAALRQYDPKLIGGKMLAGIATLLASLEVQEGGPYRTWLVGADAGATWKDVDLAVNSTIAYFLSLSDIRLENVERLIGDAIRKNRLTSPYYPGAVHVAYFVSRPYREKQRDGIAEALLAVLRKRREKMTLLERAMAISATVNLGCSEKIGKKEITSLLKDISKEGWLSYAFCIDPSRDGKRCYAGSSALTAAFCVEALVKYSAITATSLRHHAPDVSSRARFCERIKTMAEKDCRGAGENLGKIAAAKIAGVTDENIILLPRDFRETLGKRGSAIPEATIEHLALASLYGWLSCTIYDDFLDDEGDPLHIPAANLFARKLGDHYAFATADMPGAANFFKATMNAIDEASAWEQARCRISEGKILLTKNLSIFKNYDNLADRSIGHALGPLTELLLIGYARESKEFVGLASFFRHYLIARQLHDDAHDWEKDLAHGRMTSVIALILQSHKTNSPKLITEAIPILRNLFWTQIVDETVNLIRSHLTAARKAREGSDILAESAFMERAMASLEQSAQKTIDERDETLKFLAAYAPSPENTP